MDPHYMDNLEKDTFKPCTPTVKKIVKQKGCVPNLLKFVNLLSVEKELGWGGEISSAYYIRIRFLWKSKVWPFGSGDHFEASISIMPFLYEL